MEIKEKGKVLGVAKLTQHENGIELEATANLAGMLGMADTLISSIAEKYPFDYMDILTILAFGNLPD